MPELNVVPGGAAGGTALPSFAEVRQQLEVQPQGVGALAEVAGTLKSRCPQLAGILQSSEVAAEIELWRRQDEAAQGQQSRLMREATAANVCLLLAGVLSGFVLAGAAGRTFLESWWGGLTDNLVLWLGILTLILGALAAMFGHIARDQDRLGRWRTQRGAAEVAKLGAFRAIAQRAAADGQACATYALAVVDRHLLTDQRLWLAAAAKRHRRSSEWTSIWGGIATALAFVGGSGAVIGGFEPGKAWVALAGVIGAAVAAYAANREALRRDRANADRYEKTQAVLDGLAARADAIALEIAGGKPEALVAFTEAVAEPLAAEHKDWLEGSTQTEAALAGLQGKLDEMRSAPGA